MKTARLWVLVVFLFANRKVVEAQEEEAEVRWDNWSRWSPCSTDCGTGVSTRSRDCRSTVTGETVDGCSGEHEEIRVCKETGCLRQVTTHNACRKLQSRVYGGKRYRWEPYLHPSRPCELACRPLGAGFYLGLDMHVPDGSPCKEGSTNICVQGVCKDVGCDGVVGSMAVKDRCGECAGDGSSCKQVVRTFTKPLKFGYHTLATVPRGATAITVTEIGTSRNYIAVQATDKSFQLNTMYRLSRFGDHPGAGTLFTYNRAAGPDCPDECITAHGPINVPIEVLALVYSDETMIKVEYNIPNYVQDYTHRDEGTSPLVQIETGVITADTGQQIHKTERKRPIFSHDFKFKHSKRRHKTRNNVDITNEFGGNDKEDDNVANDRSISGETGAFGNPASGNKKFDDRYDNDITGETNEREVVNNTALDTNINVNKPAVKETKTGVGTKTLTTGTMTLDGETGNEEEEDAETEQEQTAVAEGQEDEEEEEEDAVAKAWEEEAEEEEEEEEEESSDSESDSEVGPGEEEEESVDYSVTESEDDSDTEPENLLESESEDTGIQIKPSESEEKDTTTDTTEVEIGLAGTDSENVSTETGTTEANKPVGDMYNNDKVDNSIPSPYMWSVTGYTACSQTCGQGKQTQVVECKVTDKGVVVDPKLCADQIRPEEKVKPCKEATCAPIWKPRDWSKCSKTCGIGVQMRDYMCVRTDGREVSTWECGSGSPRREERACDMGSCTSGWYYTDWETECPAVCGYGTIERQVTCISGTSNANTVCPLRDRPVAEKSCRNDDCGGFWLTGPWSKCNATCGEAYQTRAVTCAQKHRDRITVVSEYACQEEEKPQTYMSCDLPQCGPDWFMNNWGECSVTCGSGQRSRDVRCLSADKFPSSGCDPRSKPAEREACTMRSCPIADQAQAPSIPQTTRRPRKPKVTPANNPHCKDRFDQCSFVLQARLCNYDYYQKVCCKSCAMVGKGRG